jgi:hypothetical protein
MTISTLFYEFGFCEIVVRIQQFFMILVVRDMGGNRHTL